MKKTNYTSFCSWLNKTHNLYQNSAFQNIPKLYNYIQNARSIVESFFSAPYWYANWTKGSPKSKTKEFRMMLFKGDWF